ncbi:MAG TPA: alpha/beta hydrolase [Opitutaceae bacterium]
MKHLPAFVTAVVALLCWFLPGISAELPDASDVRVLVDVPYKDGDDLSAYEKERCKLDLYLPAGRGGFATLVWFHGGGLKAGDKQGEKSIARSLARAGVAVVSANYRFSPHATFPAYVEDAAAAFAWVHSHMAEHGGDPARLFIGGHSAGGYLALLVGLDARYLRACGLELSAIAGVVPVSGQTMTHYTVREEKGIGQFTIVADEAAPVHHSRKDTPPMLVLYADHDMPARAEENAYFVALMQGAGNTRVAGRLIRDRDHGSIARQIAVEDDPARLAIISFMASEVGEHQRL